MKDTRERWMLRHMENGTKMHTHDDHSTSLWPDRAQERQKHTRTYCLIGCKTPLASCCRTKRKQRFVCFSKQFGHTHKHTFRPLVACVPRPLSLMSQHQKQNPVTSTIETCAIRLETCLHTSQLSPLCLPTQPPHPHPTPSMQPHQTKTSPSLLVAFEGPIGGSLVFTPFPALGQNPVQQTRRSVRLRLGGHGLRLRDLGPPPHRDGALVFTLAPVQPSSSCYCSSSPCGSTSFAPPPQRV